MFLIFFYLKESHLNRLKKSENIIKELADDSDKLERWYSTCHIFGSQIDEINRIVENDNRFRSSEKSFFFIFI